MIERIQKLLELASFFSPTFYGDSDKEPGVFKQCLAFCFGLLFVMLLLPFSLLFALGQWFVGRFAPPKLSAFKKLDTELQSIWYGESSEKSLAVLRDVHQQLTERFDDLIGKGIEIPPYGRFKVMDYQNIVWLRYHYEVSHHHWKEANDACDEIMQYLDLKSNSKFWKSLGKGQYANEWLVNKAKMLEKLEGPIIAQQYLLEYLDSDNPDSLVNTYFHELREKSGNVPHEKKQDEKPPDKSNVIDFRRKT